MLEQSFRAFCVGIVCAIGVEAMGAAAVGAAVFEAAIGVGVVEGVGALVAVG